MKVNFILTVFFFISLVGLTCCNDSETKTAEFDTEASYVPKPYNLEAMYDENQPQPKVVTPGTTSTSDRPGEPPSDAVILFDGKDLSQWLDGEGNPAKWKIENGYMESVKGAGQIHTKQGFGCCQLHVEWAAPAKVTGEGQGRGNSGVFLMNQYEVQVLDSYNNKTYPPGSAAAIYSQSAPLVNASRPPGEWQTYDIIFHRPIFKDDKVIKPAVVTVFHNGVLVQDNFEIMGPTKFKEVPSYQAHPDKLPLGLQDHRNPVRFRNIWIRELSDSE